LKESPTILLNQQTQDPAIGDDFRRREKDDKMRNHGINHDMADRPDTAFVRADPRTSGSASIHFFNPSTQLGRQHNHVQGTGMPPTLWNEMVEFQADIDGLPILFRLLVKDVPTEVQSGEVASYADIHSLLSSTLEQMVNRMRGSSPRRNDLSKPPLAIAEMIPSGETPARPPAPPMETVLRVGPLELDLLDRTAKRGDR
jgi:hypothetical protein